MNMESLINENDKMKLGLSNKISQEIKAIDNISESGEIDKLNDPNGKKYISIVNTVYDLCLRYNY